MDAPTPVPSRQLVTGDPIPLEEGTDEVHGYTHLPADPGRINRLTEHDISAIPGVVRVQLDVPTGSPAPDMRRSSRTRLALAKAPDRTACETVLREVIATVRRINTPPPPPARPLADRAPTR